MLDLIRGFKPSHLFTRVLPGIILGILIGFFTWGDDRTFSIFISCFFGFHLTALIYLTKHSKWKTPKPLVVVCWFMFILMIGLMFAVRKESKKIDWKGYWGMEGVVLKMTSSGPRCGRLKPHWFVGQLMLELEKVSCPEELLRCVKK